MQNKYDKYIIDIFITSKLKINGNQIRKLDKYPNITNYLLTRYDDEQTISIIIWRIYYHIEYRNKCLICGNLTKFDKLEKHYKKYCCASCAAKSLERNEKYRETCLNKYGHINPMHNKEIRNNIIKNWINIYGVDNPMKSEYIKNKSRKTCLTKYGVEYSFQSTNNIKKSKQTKLKKYNNENYINLEKRKKTCLEKYGADEIVKSEYFKEKYKQTLLNKYGVDNSFKIPEISLKAHSKETQNKINETKRKNKTFNTSIPEQKSYGLLKDVFSDVIYQYKSDIYPFACDFYIPSLDLYIECNYHWTHGKKAFENSFQDNQIIEKWKSKNTKFYNNAIKTWTILDVRKRTIAKENKLNYLEFWNIDELKKWLSKYNEKTI